MDAFDGVFFHPGHEGAETLADFFDGVVLAGFEEGVVFFVAAVVFGDPGLGEFAGLDVIEGGFHAFLDGGVNDFGADADVAPLGGFGDGEAHAADAGFVHEVDDEFQFVQAFEVGHFGLVTGFDEGFKAGLNEGGCAAAEDGLFAEEVGFGFFLESGLDDAGAGGADAFGPGQRELFGVFAGVLIDGDEGGNAFAFHVLAADDVAGAFGCDEDDVHVVRAGRWF